MFESNLFCLIFSLFSFNKYKNTGNVQTFTAPASTVYKLEVWGAQGGTGYLPEDNTIYGIGGKGGYSMGTQKVSTILYIVVGGSGLNSSKYECKPIKGGYNGGGTGGANGDTTWGSGGGATHIASSTGLLSSLSTNKSSVIIVAGGGGGG